MVSAQITAAVLNTAQDPKAGAKLQVLAQKAQGKAPNSPEVQALLRGVGVTPRDLARLSPAGGALGWEPTLLTLTLTSAACLTTTTTTTTIGAVAAPQARPQVGR